MSIGRSEIYSTMLKMEDEISRLLLGSVIRHMVRHSIEYSSFHMGKRSKEQLSGFPQSVRHDAPWLTLFGMHTDDLVASGLLTRS